MKVTCDYCGKKFYKNPSRCRRVRHHFCSKECYVKWQREHADEMAGYPKKQNWSTYKKILHLAQLRAQLMGGEK